MVYSIAGNKYCKCFRKALENFLEKPEKIVYWDRMVKYIEELPRAFLIDQFFYLAEKYINLKKRVDIKTQESIIVSENADR